MEKEWQIKKQKAWKAYWLPRRVFKSKMCIPSKVTILKSCVIPVLTYGARSWNLTYQQYKKLQVTQRSSLSIAVNFEFFLIEIDQTQKIDLIKNQL